MQQRLIPQVSMADLVAQTKQLHLVNRQLHKDHKDAALLKEQFKVLHAQVTDGLLQYRFETALDTRNQLKALREVLVREQALFDNHALRKSRKQRLQEQDRREGLSEVNTHCPPSEQESAQHSPQHLQLEVMEVMEEEALHKREEDLQHIGGVIAQLKHIMQDQQEMVAQQGDTLLQVANHINQTDRNVDQAYHQIAKAHSRARSRRKLLCCLMTLLVVVLSTLVSCHLLLR